MTKKRGREDRGGGTLLMKIRGEGRGFSVQRRMHAKMFRHCVIFFVLRTPISGGTFSYQQRHQPRPVDILPTPKCIQIRASPSLGSNEALVSQSLTGSGGWGIIPRRRTTRKGDSRDGNGGRKKKKRSLCRTVTEQEREKGRGENV